MRRAVALLALCLSFGLGACGGQEIRADEVPGPPTDLPLPPGSEALGGDAPTGGAEAPAGGAGATPTPTPTATPEATATPEGGASAEPAAPEAEEETAAAGTEGATESGAEYEEFCDQNPGAC